MPLSLEQEEKLSGLIRPLVEGLGLELVKLELTGQGRPCLRVSLDKEGGIGMEDLTKATRLVSPLLDAEDPFSFEYQLEISSPGIFRQLETEKDFLRFAGSKVKVKVKGESVRSLMGTLLGVEEGVGIVVEAENGKETIGFDTLVQVNLNPDL